MFIRKIKYTCTNNKKIFTNYFLNIFCNFLIEVLKYNIFVELIFIRIRILDFLL